MGKSVGQIETQGLAFEKVWAMFQETKERLQELKESQLRTDRQMQETDRVIKGLSKEVKIVNQSVGETGNAVGDVVEGLFQGGIISVLSKKYDFNVIDQQNNIKLEDSKFKTDIDCLVIGRSKKTDHLFICECKNKLRKRDIETFYTNIHKIIALLPKQCDYIYSNKPIYTWVFGYAKIEKSATETINNLFKSNDLNYLKIRISGDGLLKIEK